MQNRSGWVPPSGFSHMQLTCYARSASVAVSIVPDLRAKVVGTVGNSCRVSNLQLFPTARAHTARRHGAVVLSANPSCMGAQSRFTGRFRVYRPVWVPPITPRASTQHPVAEGKHSRAVKPARVVYSPQTLTCGECPILPICMKILTPFQGH